MRRVFILSLCIGTLVAAAWAQPGPDQPERRGERRGERLRGERPDRGAWADRMYERIADELELDDEQRRQFDEITAAQRQRMREGQERWMEVRRAEREGDEERAAQLRAELGERPRPGGGMSEMLEELEPILREDQIARLWEIQDRMERGRGDRERYGRMIRELPDELGLDEGQREEFQEILTAQREQMRERWSQQRPLMEQMREAQEAGDQERVEELRRQLEESRPDPATMFDGFFEDLAEILTEEQQQRLAKYREQMETGGRGERGGADDVRDVLRAAKRLRLSSEQKDELRDIERGAIREYRQIGRRDQKGQADLAAAVRKEVAEMLDAEQVKQFEQQLQRLGGRSRRGER